MTKVIYSKGYENIEKKGLDIKVLKKKSKANTYSGWLLSRVQHCRSDGNLELALVYQDAYKQYIQFQKKEKEKYIIKGAEMWQGKDSYTLFQGLSGQFYLTEFRKDKETKEVKESEPIEVSTDKINFLIQLIKTIDVGEKLPARVVWYKIIKAYQLEKEGVTTENFNGGGDKRSTYYFPMYLYPARVLEQIGLVKLCGGKGGIKRIK